MITVSLEGLDNLDKLIIQNRASIRKDVSAVVNQSLKNIRNNIIRKLQRGTPQGRYYKRGRKVHRASAGGQPPATDRGQLVGSVFVQHEGLFGYSGVRTKYALYLEYGTTKMQARPFVFPTAEEEQSVFIENLKKVIQ